MIQWQRTRVYIKALWSDDWVLYPDIQAITVEQNAAPSYSRAVISWKYGKRNLSTTTELTVQSPVDLNDQFLQIRAVTYDEELMEEVEVELFTGIIQTDSSAIAGEVYDRENEVYVDTGNQSMFAYDLSYFLDRYTYSETFVLNEGDTPSYIGNVPTMNLPGGYGGRTIGNRSAEVDIEGYYRYGVDGELWTHYEYLRTILFDVYSILPVTLVGQITELDKIITVQDVEGKTVRDILNTLVQARYGFGWRVMPVGFGADAVIPIRIFTIISDDLSVGDITLLKNDDQREVFLNPHGNENVDISITEALETRWDAIRVEGERILACGTFSLDVNCEPVWSEEIEAEYLAGAVEEDDDYSNYTDDQKAVVNDAYRSTDKFADVFRSFKLPDSWDWIIDERNLDIGTDTDGQLNTLVPLGYYNSSKVFAGFIPHANSSGDRYRTPFAVVEHEGKYYYLDRIGEAVKDENDTPYRNIGLSILPTNLGFHFNARPNHLLAGTSFDETIAEPSQYVPQYMPSQIKVTAAIRTDHKLTVTAVNKEPVRTVKTIKVPNAELWYTLKGTVIDIYGDGTLKQASTAVDGKSAPESTDEYWVNRDDSAILQSIAVAAKSWYGKARKQIEYTLNYLTSTAEPGVMIKAAITDTGYTDINSLITRVAYDCRACKSTVKTQYEGVDFSVLAQLQGGNSDINDIKERMASIPSRQPVSSGGGGGGSGAVSGLIFLPTTQVSTYTYAFNAKQWKGSLEATNASETVVIYFNPNKSAPAPGVGVANSEMLTTFNLFNYTQSSLETATLIYAQQLQVPPNNEIRYVAISPNFFYGGTY